MDRYYMVDFEFLFPSAAGADFVLLKESLSEFAPLPVPSDKRLSFYEVGDTQMPSLSLPLNTIVYFSGDILHSS